MKYIPTIGLEIHSQLNTRTKMFCDSLNDPEETRPNVNVCPICLAHPGTLPVPNIEAVKKVIKAGLALGCEIAEYSFFERKNYFYPDLPKGYQISQFESPLCQNGELELSSGKKIKIKRIHLEEDTGRLLHDQKESVALVDFNRAGVPLMELVTEPNIESAQEAKEFGEKLQLLLRYIDVSGADMEKGQMRLEANVSIRPEEEKEFGTKVELKNINSFRAMERAVEYEIKRQAEVLGRGEKVMQETRGWDDNKQATFSQRTKEESQDYRYFPEPDIPPMRFESSQIEAIRAEIAELPQERKDRFQKEYGIKPDDAEFFVVNRELGEYFEQVISELSRWIKDGGIENGSTELTTGQEAGSKVTKLAANYIISELQGLMVDAGVGVKDLKITPENFAELIIMVQKGTVSSTGAQQILKEMFDRGIDPSQLLDELKLEQVSDEAELARVADAVIAANPKAVEDYKKGKEASLKFLVGQIMRQMRGRANPQVAAEVLKKILG